METQKLTKVGGSVMLTIPPRALKQLQLTAGSQVNVAISDGQLVVTPATGPIGIKARLAMCDFSVSPDGDRAGGGAQLGSHARGRGRRNLRSSANVSARCTGCIPRVRGWPSSSLTALPRCRVWPGGALSSGDFSSGLGSGRSTGTSGCRPSARDINGSHQGVHGMRELLYGDRLRFSAPGKLVCRRRSRPWFH